MVVKNRVSGKKCPKCGETLTPSVTTTTNGQRVVSYRCEKCGYVTNDDKNIDVDVRYAPTFNSYPIIRI